MCPYMPWGKKLVHSVVLPSKKRGALDRASWVSAGTSLRVCSICPKVITFLKSRSRPWQAGISPRQLCQNGWTAPAAMPSAHLLNLTASARATTISDVSPTCAQPLALPVFAVDPLLARPDRHDSVYPSCVTNQPPNLQVHALPRRSAQRHVANFSAVACLAGFHGTCDRD
jgi:hypothetical protein